MTPENILSDLIRINTINPPGNETAAAMYLKKLFDEAGISNEIIEPVKGRGSFVARLGRGNREHQDSNGGQKQKKMLLLSHTDVVPAGEGWNFDPLSGEIKDGTVLGRGALDCKHLVAAQAYTMLKLKKENIPINGEVILAAVADEETGGNLGAKYLFQHHPRLMQADFAINEGAEKMAYINKRPVYFIQVGEKGTAWSKFKARGTACHGSVPGMGDNAVA